MGCAGSKAEPAGNRQTPVNKNVIPTEVSKEAKDFKGEWWTYKGSWWKDTPPSPVVAPVRKKAWNMSQSSNTETVEDVDSVASLAGDDMGDVTFVEEWRTLELHKAALEGSLQRVALFCSTSAKDLTDVKGHPLVVTLSPLTLAPLNGKLPVDDSITISVPSSDLSKLVAHRRGRSTTAQTASNPQISCESSVVSRLSSLHSGTAAPVTDADIQKFLEPICADIDPLPSDCSPILGASTSIAGANSTRASSKPVTRAAYTHSDPVIKLSPINSALSDVKSLSHLHICPQILYQQRVGQQKPNSDVPSQIPVSTRSQSFSVFLGSENNRNPIASGSTSATVSLDGSNSRIRLTNNGNSSATPLGTRTVRLSRTYSARSSLMDSAWGTTVDATSVNHLASVIHASGESHSCTGACYINAYDDDGNAAIHLAAKRGLCLIIKDLIRLGADVCRKDRFGDEPIHLAAQKGHVDTVIALVEAGADINVSGSSGTPLHRASSQGHVTLVKYLLSKNARTNVDGPYRETPLHLASTGGHAAVVKVLLEAGSDPNARDASGDVPLHDSAGRGFSKVVQLLIAAKADVNAVNNPCVTPLHTSSYTGALDVVKQLVTAGANVNARNKASYTPLHLAAERGHALVVRYLCEHDAMVNLADRLHGDTPLHLAAGKGHLAATLTLLEFNASVHLTNNWLERPYDISLDVAIKDALIYFGTIVSALEGWTPVRHCECPAPFQAATKAFLECIVSSFGGSSVGARRRGSSMLNNRNPRRSPSPLGFSSECIAFLRDHPAICEKIIRATARIWENESVPLRPSIDANDNELSYSRMDIFEVKTPNLSVMNGEEWKDSLKISPAIKDSDGQWFESANNR